MPQSCVDCHVEPATEHGSGKRCAECFARAYVDLYGYELSMAALAVHRAVAPKDSPWNIVMEAVAATLRRRYETEPR